VFPLEAGGVPSRSGLHKGRFGPDLVI